MNIKGGKSIESQHWFEKHKGHNVIVKEIDIIDKKTGKKITVKGGPKDYKCMDCGRGLVSSAKPGDKPMSAEGVFKHVLGGGPKDAA